MCKKELILCPRHHEAWCSGWARNRRAQISPRPPIGVDSVKTTQYYYNNSVWVIYVFVDILFIFFLDGTSNIDTVYSYIWCRIGIRLAIEQVNAAMRIIVSNLNSIIYHISALIIAHEKPLWTKDELILTVIITYRVLLIRDIYFCIAVKVIYFTIFSVTVDLFHFFRKHWIYHINKNYLIILIVYR